MIKDDVLKLLGISISDTAKVAIVDILLAQSQNKICAYINASLVPAELNFIVCELTVERYNKLGSEGFTSESIEGIQYSYNPNELAQYKVYLDRYVSKSSGFIFL